jgi:pantoate--beta-alanine ligase
MTTLINSIADWQKIRDKIKSQSIGFVPTMGNLHAGHASLLARSKKENDVTVLSIFVNPTQFNNQDDLVKYPRTIEQDIRLAKDLKTDYVLVPEYKELYCDGYRFKISENNFSKILCGEHRPGHFDGVLTIVMKLLNLIKANRAYFGEKDFQQLQLIRDMANAFFMDTEIIAAPIIRDENGLALSSRNNRLSKEQYQQALTFPKLLAAKKTCKEIIAELAANNFKVDYIEEHFGRRFGAVWVGDVRLIDNTSI